MKNKSLIIKEVNDFLKLYLWKVGRGEVLSNYYIIKEGVWSAKQKYDSKWKSWGGGWEMP